jgi:hypothetical protein
VEGVEQKFDGNEKLELAGCKDINSLAVRRLSFDTWVDESQGAPVGSSSVGFNTPTRNSSVPPMVRFIFFLLIGMLRLITCYENIFMRISICIAVLVI